MQRLSQVEARQTELESALEKNLGAVDAAVRAAFDAATTASLMANWSFDARMPNTLSGNLSLPERDASGRWVRWLLGMPRLEWTVQVTPNRQYDLTVVVPKFVSRRAYDGLYVRANGEDLPWLSWDGAVRGTIVGAGQDGVLKLALAVPETEEADAPFAVASINLKVR
ncbi:hypothetical protein M446_3997 [Methylobacterium sp. 4-46]|nr:hypothetical protein M446_3997 [Methylobacterium sp. 4-46]